MSNYSTAGLFYISVFYHSNNLFLSASKIKKQKKCCLLLKYHLFFTLIYCHLATSPLVPSQVIRLGCLGKGGTLNHRSGSLFLASIPTKCPLRVSCLLFGFLSLDRAAPQGCTLGKGFVHSPSNTGQKGRCFQGST